MNLCPRDTSPSAGVVLSQDDYTLSVLIAYSLDAQPHHCYENAYPALFAFPELLEPHGQFIEGWIVFVHQDAVVLMEHGFLMNGTHILDPTIVLEVEFDEPLYYFPGVIRDRDELLQLENELFPHVRFSEYGDDGMAHPEYRAAYEAARQKALSLATGGKTVKEVRARHLTQEELEAEVGEPSAMTIVILPNHDEMHYGQDRM